METSTLKNVERILLVTCCLIITPAITTPKRNSELNPENPVQFKNIIYKQLYEAPIASPVSTLVPKFHYLSEDSSKEEPWNYDYPRFSMPVQEKSLEAKRRSSFFPVRGKKVVQNLHLFNGKSEPESVYADYKSSPILPQLSLENVADAFDFMDYPKWTAAQKRPSSFMPMRGRKRQVDGDNLKFLEQYLSSRARESYLDPVNNDFFHRPVYSGIRKIDANRNDRTNYPYFYDKSAKGEVDFLDGNQIEKHLKFATDGSSVGEVENGGTAISPKFFSNEKIPEKRALSFVPTRGRREKLREIEPDLGISHTVVELSDSFPTGQISANLSRYPFPVGGEIHQRYRRASAFMPMRGRKSLFTAYGHPAYLAMDQLPRLGDSQRSNGIYDTEQELPGGMLGSFDNTDDIRQKRGFNRVEMQFPLTQQKLRTALVMKRPLSFFAARGKRLNVSGIETL